MSDAFHVTDPLDAAEQLLAQQSAIVAQLQSIIANHRRDRRPVLTHDGSQPVNPCAIPCVTDDPPSRETE